MKKRGRRCLISLLLGLCLLMPSQMKVLAADAQEDSSSVQAVEEAMPDQENATTIDENQIDNTMPVSYTHLFSAFALGGEASLILYQKRNKKKRRISRLLRSAGL